MPKKKFIIITLITILILILSSGLVFFFYPKSSPTTTPVSEEATQKETTDIMAALGKIAELPQNETPTIATVSDKDKVKNQTFFIHAQNGDKVLIFAQAKRAVLYRPSSGKVIEITTISVGPSPTPIQVSTPSATVTY